MRNAYGKKNIKLLVWFKFFQRKCSTEKVNTHILYHRRADYKTKCQNLSLCALKEQNTTLIKVIFLPRSRHPNYKSHVAEWNCASRKIKGADTKIACLFCMLLAVMHESISQPYCYSDYTQRTHTIQIRG